MTKEKFIAFSASHNIALIVTLILTYVFIKIANYPGHHNYKKFLTYLLSILIISSLVAKITFFNYSGSLTLPMHLCDWAAIAIAITLLSKNKLLFEVSFFWGLSGTFQALLTPDLARDFPHFSYFSFFTMHSGIIIAIFFAIFVQGHIIRKGAVLRVFAISQIYLISALLINLTLDKNYGFLLRKPSKATLFDYLGPWPFYIISLEVCTLLFFTFFHFIFKFFVFKKRKL